MFMDIIYSKIFSVNIYLFINHNLSIFVWYLFMDTINNIYKTCLISFTQLVSRLIVATEGFLSYPVYVSLSPTTSASDSKQHQKFLQGIFTLPL